MHFLQASAPPRNGHVAYIYRRLRSRRRRTDITANDYRSIENGNSMHPWPRQMKNCSKQNNQYKTRAHVRCYSYPFIGIRKEFLRLNRDSRNSNVSILSWIP